MPESYGQFCPVAQAAEVLTERWTLLVVRELLMGSTRFNDIQRGVPRMSSSLLSKRLRELERGGLLTREALEGERGHTYRLTPAGEALGPLVVSLGTWSRDWLKRDISDEEADPALLMWDMRRRLRLDRLPQDPVVTFFRYRDAEDGKRAWWLVAQESGADVCFSDPGFSSTCRSTPRRGRWRRSGWGDSSWVRRCGPGGFESAVPSIWCAAFPTGSA